MFPPERGQFADSSVPFLPIVPKFDQIPENKRIDVLTWTAFLSEDFNAEEIRLVGASSLQLPFQDFMDPHSGQRQPAALSFCYQLKPNV